MADPKETRDDWPKPSRVSAAAAPPSRDVGHAATADRKSEDLVVFITRHDGTCAECNEPFFRGAIIRVENGRTMCLDCADLGRLEFLARGDTALTRRATKHARLRAVVVQWARARKRYERQGILVSAQAIQKAEAECLADADARERQRERAARARQRTDAAYQAEAASELRRLFPGSPPGELEQVAAWTCEKNSGRVGRSATAKQLDRVPLRLAVIAHIRHEHTRYDELLMETGDRGLARDLVREDVDRMLRAWEAPAGE